MDTASDQLHQQGDLFGRYLTKKPVNTKFIERYSQAVKAFKITPTEYDKKLLDYVIKHPWSLGLLDAALPLYRPYAELRHRIYLMLAILEASPDYQTLFLPVRRSAFHIVRLMLCSLRAIIKTVIGSLLLRLFLRDPHA
jgi:hypothetical protein